MQPRPPVNINHQMRANEINDIQDVLKLLKLQDTKKSYKKSDVKDILMQALREYHSDKNRATNSDNIDPLEVTKALTAAKEVMNDYFKKHDTVTVGSISLQAEDFVVFQAQPQEKVIPEMTDEELARYTPLFTEDYTDSDNTSYVTVDSPKPNAYWWPKEDEALIFMKLLLGKQDEVDLEDEVVARVKSTFDRVAKRMNVNEGLRDAFQEHHKASYEHGRHNRNHYRVELVIEVNLPIDATRELIADLKDPATSEAAMKKLSQHMSRVATKERVFDRGELLATGIASEPPAVRKKSFFGGISNMFKSKEGGGGGGGGGPVLEDDAEASQKHGKKIEK